MNNGKVRIYELSKELNLDNKELLAICDQLDIAVKSHSSTISESEAERIRMAAEKLTANNLKGNNTSSKLNTSETGDGAERTAGGNRNRPTPPHKPQILEIRKPKILRNNTRNAHQASVANDSQLASLEVNSSSQSEPIDTSVSPMKPTAPIRPVPRNQSENSPESANKPVDPVSKIEAPETRAAAKPEKAGTERSRSPVSLKSKAEKQPQKPHLAEPPARPVAANSRVASGQSPTEKPVLKRDQVKQKPQRGTSTDTPQSPAKQHRATPKSPVKADQKGNRGAGQAHPEQRLRNAPLADGTKPSRPVRPSEVVAAMPVATPPKPMSGGQKKPDLDTESIVPELLDLKRPTPPRLSKGGKKWQEEEIIDEIKEKSGKVGNKGKRVKPIVEDDFEEEDLLDDEDQDSQATVHVSLSIARPPKPKAARGTQPLTASVISAPTARKKKSFSRRDQNRRQEVETKRERPEKVVITGPMTVQELADVFAIADTEIVKILFLKGMAVSITQNLDIPTITLIGKELEIEIETAEPEAEARKVTEMLDVADMELLQRRPPVVTIMGHVDHGKTTLLDSIRKTKVAAGEAGGITQHIGAYHVDVEHEGKTQQIVFLDTPGHEAFTAMRARGARVTDIAVLVVAADDGVRPQTVEAISHAQAAGVPIVVAINKIDKEGAQPDRVKQELTQYGLTPEEWGGETIMVPVSAIKGENLDTLLDMILLVAEVGELSANPDRAAKGTVIEAHLDKAKGAVATLLIQNGTLHVGDMLVAGSAFGKVRAMVDDRGKRVEVAGPSFAVEVLGLSDVPAAGDEFEVFANEKEARSLAGDRADKKRLSRLLQGRVTLTTLSAQAQEGELKELNLILKADVQGSVEAIIGSLRQIPQNEVQIRMLLATAGEITETDIDLAAASGAVIIGFNTTYASGARQAADEAGVDVREYNIIYKLLEDIQGALEGLLEPELVEEPLGQTEVRAVFPVGRGAVAGCYVQSGKLVRNCKVRVRRSGKLVYEGVLDSLKRMKEDVREVNSGYECGINIDKFHDWVEGDVIEAFQMVTKRRTLTLTR
jgi:translation initiation factor IF-2